MLGRLFKRKRSQRRLLSYSDYYKHYYRELSNNPERFEQEQETVRQWVLGVMKRKEEASGEQSYSPALNERDREKANAAALEQMRVVARQAFMSHPAATEADFRRCWPTIRAEMLKQHTLEELAARPSAISALLPIAKNEALASQSYPAVIEHDDKELLQAARDGNVRAINVLLMSGANPNSILDGWTALMIATIKGHCEIVRALLNKGADANLKNHDGLTALRFAVAMADIEIMQVLLSKGAHVNTQDNDGWTPIMQAADENGVESVKVLLARGADLSLKSKNGETALRLAEGKSYDVIAHLLKRAGAI
ncbi:MAG: ankyrin repeat domain-containing protein [Pyrinomonadaceae bacterium]